MISKGRLEPFPAGAGINRDLSLPFEIPPSVPRRRGDKPLYIDYDYTPVPRSPQARG